MIWGYEWQLQIHFPTTTVTIGLAHAVNAISEFTKKLKKWIESQGC